MAGSKRRGYTPSVPTSPCASLVFNATVNSPQAVIIAQLKLGDVLGVTLIQGGQGVVVHYNGAVVGSLTSTHIARLIDCMNSGFQYKATVVTLNGGQCVVRVETI